MIAKGKLNRWTITGNAGSDAETIQTTNGRELIKFRCATVQGFKEDDTLWVNVVQYVDDRSEFGRIAKEKALSVKKGDLVLIDGYAQYRTFTKKDGSAGYDLSIVADGAGIVTFKKGADSRTSARGNNEENLMAPQDDDIPF